LVGWTHARRPTPTWADAKTTTGRESGRAAMVPTRRAGERIAMRRGVAAQTTMGRFRGPSAFPIIANR